MTRRGFFGLLVGAAALLLAACGSTRRMRYRMTVEIETPEGAKTGHAVREIRYIEPSSSPSIGESRPQWRVEGEAVAVDLPGGRTLFALLSSGDGGTGHAGRDIWFMLREFGPKAPGGVIELWPRTPRATSPIIPDPLPMLLAFRDIDDPGSAEQVDPANMAAQLGAGFGLRRVTIEQVDEAITTGIADRLHWLASNKARRVRLNGKSGPIFTNELTDNLGTGALKAD